MWLEVDSTEHSVEAGGPTASGPQASSGLEVLEQPVVFLLTSLV